MAAAAVAPRLATAAAALWRRAPPRRGFSVDHGASLLVADPSLIGPVQGDDSGASAADLPQAPPLAVYPDAVSEAEEARLLAEADRWLGRKPYERGHFDRVIVGYACV